MPLIQVQVSIANVPIVIRLSSPEAVEGPSASQVRVIWQACKIVLVNMTELTSGHVRRHVC